MRASRILPLPLLICSFALGTPPKLDYLYPAGAGRGETHEITAVGSISRWPVEVIVDSPGLTITPKEEKGKLHVVVDADAAPGVYFVRLADKEGVSSMRPFIIDTLPSVLETNPNDDIESAQPIDRPMIVDGRLEKSGDTDVFCIPLKKGQTLVAAVTANQLLGSPMDTVMQLLDAKGFTILQNDDCVGVDPRIVYTATEDADHFLRIFAFPATPNSTIRFSGASNFVYRLTLTTDGYLEHTDPLSTADKSFELIGWNLGEASGQSHMVKRDPTISWISHPRAASFARVMPPKLPIHRESELSENPVAWPATISGSIATPGEEDEFAIELAEPMALRFKIRSDSIDQLLDPRLMIFDAEGTRVFEVDDTNSQRDFSAEYKFQAAGRYTLKISDLAADGGLQYAYLLTIDKSRPGFQLSLESDSYALKPAESITIPVKVDREKGCNDVIEFEIENLPEFVELLPSKSEPKDATAKEVKLELRCGTGTFSGPIYISARRSGTEAPLSAATFPISGTAMRRSDVWLHIDSP